MGLEDRDWLLEEPSAAWRSPEATLALVVSAVVIAVGWNLYLLRLQAGAAPKAPRAAAPAIAISPTTEMRTAATRTTSWSVSDPHFGTITVLVPPGMVPLTTLTDELRARGYRVALT